MLKFGLKGLMQWAYVADLIREIRFFWPAASCGTTWPLVLLGLVLAFCCGACLGISCTLVATSSSVRRGLVWVFGTVLKALIAPELPDQRLALRRRLNQYRSERA